MVEGVGAGGASTAGTTRSSGLRAALTAPSSFRWHALGLLVILLALLPVIDNGSIGFVDEGVYAAQAANLADGSWGSPLVEPELNPDGRYNAVTSSATIGNSVIPYARQPLYPLILTPAYAVGGLTGLMLVSLAGTWIAALAGAGIARLLDARLAIPTLWLLGAGSPLLFDAYFMVGHSLVAAAAGVTAWAMLKAGRFDERTPPRAVWLVLAVPAAAVAVLLRSEGVLAVGLLGVAGAACSWTAEDRRLRPDWRRVTVSGSIAVTAIAAYKLNAMWAASITSGARVGGDVPRETDPVQVVWISLVQPWNADNREASVAMVIAVVATILGAVTLRLLPKRPLLPIALLFRLSCRFRGSCGDGLGWSAG